MSDTSQPFDLFNKIIAALDERPRAPLKDKWQIKLPKAAVYVCDIPQKLWGLYNLAIRSKKAFDAAQKKNAGAPMTSPKHKELMATNQILAGVWGLALRDEIPELQKYDQIYSVEAKLYGAQPHDFFPVRIGAIETLRQIHGSQKGSHAPMGATPPYGCSIIADTPPWMIALHAIRVRMDSEMSVRTELASTLDGLARFGIMSTFGPLMKATNTGIMQTNDGKMYEIPIELATPINALVEQIGRMFGGEVEIITPDDKPKRLM